MKISEFIEKLKIEQSLHGDIDVKCWPYDGQSFPVEITEVLKSNNSIGPFIVVDGD